MEQRNIIVKPFRYTRVAYLKSGDILVQTVIQDLDVYGCSSKTLLADWDRRGREMFSRDICLSPVHGYRYFLSEEDVASNRQARPYTKVTYQYASI